MTSTGQLKSVLSMITQGRRLWKAMSGDIVISACNGRSKNLEGNVGGFCCLCTEMLHVTPLAAYWSELVICPALNARGLEVWFLCARESNETGLGLSNSNYTSGPATIKHLLCLVTQSCSTLCDPMDCRPLSMEILQPRLLEWAAMPSSRGIFLTQGSNPGLLHCRWTLYHLSH